MSIFAVATVVTSFMYPMPALDFLFSVAQLASSFAVPPITAIQISHWVALLPLSQHFIKKLIKLNFQFSTNYSLETFISHCDTHREPTRRP